MPCLVLPGQTFARKTPRTAQPCGKANHSTEVYAEVRNTRSVVPIRLSDGERKRISRAAEARDLRFSSFIRWAALERAADELERAKPKPRPKVEREPIILEPEPPAPEEEPFRPHHFVDGECQRCGLELNDHRGRDLPCTPMVMV